MNEDRKFPKKLLLKKIKISEIDSSSIKGGKINYVNDPTNFSVQLPELCG